MDAKQWAASLKEAALLLELKGENRFKVSAFLNAARTVERLGTDELRELDRAGDLGSVKGFGKALREQVHLLVNGQSLELLEELRREVPSGLVEMTRISGLGPKKVLKLHTELGLEEPGELEYACLENRLVSLPGFGAKSQASILEGVRFLLRNRGRHRFPVLERVAAELVALIRSESDVHRVDAAGSLRRACGVVSNIDLVMAADNPGSVFQVVERWVSDQGGRASSAGHLPQGEFAVSLETLKTELRIFTVSPSLYGAALLAFTGSREHLKQLASMDPDGWISGVLQNGWPGDAPGEDFPDLEDPCAMETAVYRSLGLPFIAPELREGAGEVERAAGGTLPPPLQQTDLGGVFHVHTEYSDGTTTVATMAEAAAERGYGYLGIADHSRSAFYAGGLSVEQVLAQREEIRAYNETHPEFLVLSGIESDILPDGSLDYDDEILAGFDFVVGSVHSNFGQDEETMTRRIITAMKNPHLTMLGHPTGRLLLSRGPYAVDMERVLDTAEATGVVLELNANPYRLDLDWRWCRKAADRGIPITINPDAHRPEGLDDVRFGVLTARKGWLDTKHVLNTASRGEILDRLRTIRTETDR